MCFIKKNQTCRGCLFAEYVKSEAVLCCGFRCKLNPFKPVAMGLAGKHYQRKDNKMEQYPKKVSS